ncbi:MAG: hypothetical protein ACR2JW_17345, partial [Thermomicrobiales bacterium]
MLILYRDGREAFQELREPGAVVQCLRARHIGLLADRAQDRERLLEEFKWRDRLALIMQREGQEGQPRDAEPVVEGSRDRQSVLELAWIIHKVISQRAGGHLMPRDETYGPSVPCASPDSDAAGRGG